MDAKQRACTGASKIHYYWVQAREGKAGDGAQELSDEIVKDMHARVATGKDWRIWGGIQKALWWTGSKKGRQALDGVISGSGP